VQVAIRVLAARAPPMTIAIFPRVSLPVNVTDVTLAPRFEVEGADEARDAMCPLNLIESSPIPPISPPAETGFAAASSRTEKIWCGALASQATKAEFWRPKPYWPL